MTLEIPDLTRFEGNKCVLATLQQAFLSAVPEAYNLGLRLLPSQCSFGLEEAFTVEQ